MEGINKSSIGYFDSSALKNIYAHTYIKKQPMKTL